MLRASRLQSTRSHGMSHMTACRMCGMCGIVSHMSRLIRVFLDNRSTDLCTQMISSVYHLCIICVSSMSSVCQGILPCTGSSGGELKQLLFYFDQTRQEQPRGHCESSQAVEQFLTLYLDILDIFTALDFTPIFGC